MIPLPTRRTVGPPRRRSADRAPVCRRISSGDKCDSCDSAAALTASRLAARLPAGEQPVGHLVGGERERPVVAPGAGDVQERARAVPSSRKPSFSTTRSDAAFSGRMLTSTRCRPTAPKQWSVDQRHRGRHDAAAGDPLVDPVADVRRAQRAPGDAADGQLADEHARRRSRRTAAGCRAGPAGAASAPSRRSVIGGRRRRAAASPPTAQPARVAPAHLHPGVPVAPADRPQPDRPVAQGRRPAPGHQPWHRARVSSVVAPVDLVDRVHQQRAEHLQPVAHPAGRAGQVHDQRAPGQPGQAAGQRRGRDALAGAVRAQRLGDARAGRGRAPAGSSRGCGRSG